MQESETQTTVLDLLGGLPKRRRAFPTRTPFLCGPVPLPWLAMASRLPGATLQVGVILWYQSGLTKSRTVHIPRRVREEFGVSRHAANRALAILEAAGLVVTEKRRGCSTRVTIVED